MLLLPATALASNSYNPAAAINYASKNIGTGISDCVIFTRACVEAGGIPQQPERTYNYSVSDYVNYITQSGFGVTYKLETHQEGSYSYVDASSPENIGKVAPGDIVLYKCTKQDCPKPLFHIALVSKFESRNGYNDVYIYAENVTQDNKLLTPIMHKLDNAAKDEIEIYSIHIQDTIYNDYLKSITAKATSSNKIKITWTKSSSASSYNIYRSTSEWGKYKLVGTVSADKSYYTDSVPSMYKKYYYRVTKIDKSNNEHGLAIIKNAKTSITAPTSFAATAGSKSVSLSWKRVPLCTGYKIYRSTTSSGNYSCIKKIANSDVTSYKNNSLKKGKTYYYKIVAYKESSSKTYTSSFSSTKYATAK